MSEAVSPATHRYVGMWRPPFDGIFQDAEKAAKDRAFFICRCETLLMYYSDDTYRHYADKKLVLDHWLAGHFDVPQYELKEKA